MIKLSGKRIQGQNFIEFLESNTNLMKITLIGFEEIIKTLYEDVEKLKGAPLKPDKKTALALMGYLNLKDQKTREIIQTLCGAELQRYFHWIEDYCKEYNATRSQALRQILEGEL